METERNLKELYRILNDTEDLLTGNIRRTREDLPSVVHSRSGASVSDSGGSSEVGAIATEASASGADESRRDWGQTARASGYNRDRAESGVEDEIERIAAEVRVCAKCGLAHGRTNAVPGNGVLNPRVLVIGEGPGAEEDRLGLAFVGAAGKYLDRWLEAIGLSRDTNCFIANIVKCRPPQNRDPQPEESTACIPYLERQIDMLKPEVILTLGRVAIQNLFDTTRGIGALRGSTYEYRGVPVIPTYHPSGVLRNPSYRRDVWEDLKRLKSILDDE